MVTLCHENGKSILSISVVCKQTEEIAYIMLQIFCIEIACVSTFGMTGKLAEVEFFI